MFPVKIHFINQSEDQAVQEQSRSFDRNIPGYGSSPKAKIYRAPLTVLLSITKTLSYP